VPPARRKKRPSRKSSWRTYALIAALAAVCVTALLLWGEGQKPPGHPGMKPPAPQASLSLPPEKPAAGGHQAASAGHAASSEAPPVQQQAAVAPPGTSTPQTSTAAPAAARVPPPAMPREGGEPAWLRYAVPAPAVDGKPMIAIVIDDMGVDQRRTMKAIALPAPLTMSFLPYAKDLEPMTQAAHAAGHELMLHMPMQPMSASENPGPEALLTGLDPLELLRRTIAMLDSFTGFVGANNHMGSKFTQNADGMRIVLGELNARGLLFIDSRTIAGTAGPSVARSLGMPFAERDVFLDNDASPGNVRAKLAEVEAVARRQGHAIAIGHPHDGTVEALAQWLPEVEKRGFVLVPVSAVVKARMDACGGHAGLVKVSKC
jgi:polysaccharide deacetylase 2 family uncharacterized protein YibQ